MHKLVSIRKTNDARIVCVSPRLVDKMISRCLRYEFEDSFADADAMDIVAPGQVAMRDLPARRLAARADGAGLLPFSGSLDGRYELMITGVQSLEDLYTLAPWSTFRRAARVSACIVEEIWVRHLPRHSGALSLLRQFDLIFTPFSESIEPLAKATGRPVHFLPSSVDALALCPYPDGPARVIDFYAMGRRPAKTHAALVRWADARGMFYHYDSTGNAQVTHHVEHRRRFADLIKRTRYFLVNVAQCNEPGKTGGQEEIGYRYFEGAAGGAVLIGHAARTGAFPALFPWEDAVIPLDYDSEAIGDVLDTLERDGGRVERIRRANVTHCLTMHDHAHRAAKLLDVAGLTPTPALRKRLAELDARAAAISGTNAGSTGHQTGSAPGNAPAQPPGAPGTARTIGAA